MNKLSELVDIYIALWALRTLHFTDAYPFLSPLPSSVILQITLSSIPVVEGMSVVLSGYPVTHFYNATGDLLNPEHHLRKPPTMGFHTRRAIYLKNLFDHYSPDEVVEAVLNKIVYEELKDEQEAQAFQCMVSLFSSVIHKYFTGTFWRTATLPSPHIWERRWVWYEIRCSMCRHATAKQVCTFSL